VGVPRKEKKQKKSDVHGEREASSAEGNVKSRPEQDWLTRNSHLANGSFSVGGPLGPIWSRWVYMPNEHAALVRERE